MRKMRRLRLVTCLSIGSVSAMGIPYATAEPANPKAPQVNPQPTSPAAPAPPATNPAVPGQPPLSPTQPSIGSPTTGFQLPNYRTGSAGPTPAIQTPAQRRYGLPRNPFVGSAPSIDLSQPLTLARAIQIGLDRQDSIAITQTQTVIAQARLVQARSSYYPQVNPSFQYQSNVTPGRTFVGTTGTTGTTTSTGQIRDVPRQPRATGTGTTTGTGTGSGGVTQTGTTSTGSFVTGSTASETRTEVVAARQLIFDSGVREATVGLNRRNVFAAEYGLGNTRQDVVLAVTQSYYNVLRDRELVRVEEESVRRAQTTLDVIQAQVQAGTAAQSDTLQSLADLANARIALLSAQNSVYQDEASLKNAMGVITYAPLVLADAAPPTPSPQPDTTPLQSYVENAWNNRLDLKQQQELINAQGYNVRIARINSGLTVNATINEGYQLNPNAGEERSFLVSFSYPLFDAGSTRAAVRENRALLEQQWRNLDLDQQNISLSVEQSFTTRELARQRVAAAQIAVDAGQTNYNAALEKQKNGLINILDVINAEVQLINAQVAQVQALYDFYIADSQLRRAVGQNDPGYVPNVPPGRQVGTDIHRPK